MLNEGVILSAGEGSAVELYLRVGKLTTGRQPERLLAIDWSGALDQAAQRRGVWIADCRLNDDSPLTLASGESRAATEVLLIEAAKRTPAMVAGIDFSFSYPAWFLRRLGCATAPQFWQRVAEEGEQWLSESHPEFWGRRKESCCPADHRGPLWRGYRATELAAKSGNVLPRSSFQIGGAGAVGTGSLRGIPMLPRLRAAGFSIWPFDPPRLPMLVEIYPRLLTGPVIKSSAAARAAYLARAEFASLPPMGRLSAEGSEDAFDALVSAWRMREHAALLGALGWPPDARTRLEGAIWNPFAPVH